jgi:drug/metabolite transporter (DMT)-like permease
MLSGARLAEKRKMKSKFDFKTFAVLHFILLLYSFVGVFMKLAFTHEFLSWGFIMFAGLAVMFLGIYAVLWQQVLKKLPLTVAFTNKAICIVWGMLWGALFLGDAITWYKIVGSLIVFPGVVLVVSSNE